MSGDQRFITSGQNGQLNRVLGVRRSLSTTFRLEVSPEESLGI